MTQDVTHDRVQENGFKNENGSNDNGSKGTPGSKPDVGPAGNDSKADKARLPATTPWYKSHPDDYLSLKLGLSENYDIPGSYQSL